MTDDRSRSELFSKAPLSDDELQRLRHLLSVADAIEPLIQSYEKGNTIWKFTSRLVAWTVGAIVGGVTLVQGWKALGWWPFNGGAP